MSKHNAKSERELLIHISDALDNLLYEIQQKNKKLNKQPPKKKSVNTKTVQQSTRNKKTLLDS